MRLRLAAVATHPIQYHAPWFRALAARPDLDFTVFYAQIPDRAAQGVGFGASFAWDVPLLEGYAWEVLVNSRRRPGVSGLLASSTPGIGERLRAYAPDAALLTGWNQLPLLQALWACRRLGVPTLVRGESNGLKRRPAVLRWLHRALLRRYDAFLAIGTANTAFYVDHGVPAKAIVRCPYFVDNERFAAQATALLPHRDEIRRSLDVDRGVLCAAFVGKLIPKKRPFDLIDAAQQASRSGAPVHLLIVGSGELEAAARERCRAKAVAATFTGFLNQSEIARAYVACDVLVLPSDERETWGLVANEAMACGRCVLASDRVGCAADLIEDAKTGFTFPVGGVERLADLLGRLAHDTELCARLGANAQRRILSEFTLEGAVEAVLQALRQLGLHDVSSALKAGRREQPGHPTA